jgi:hypothetical protein
MYGALRQQRYSYLSSGPRKKMTCERDVSLFDRERTIETKIDAFSRRFHTLLLSISLLDEKT